MGTWLERLKQESVELEAKLLNLNSFLKGRVDQEVGVTTEDLEDLHRQSFYMSKYAEILRKRLTRAAERGG